MADRRARVKKAHRRNDAEDPREVVRSAPAAPRRVLGLRALGVCGYEPAAVAGQNRDHAVGIEPAPGRVPPGHEPYLLEPVGPRGLAPGHATPRVRKEP